MAKAKKETKNVYVGKQHKNYKTTMKRFANKETKEVQTEK